MDQTLLPLWSAGLTIASGVIGWWCNTIYRSMQEMRDQHDLLKDAHNSLAVNVAQNYTRTEKFDRFAERVDTKLDSIMAFLGQKADR